MRYLFDYSSKYGPPPPLYGRTRLRVKVKEPSVYRTGWLTFHYFQHRTAQRGRRIRHLETGRLHRLDLALRVTLAAGDDRAGMAHPPPGRCRGPGDESDDRLLRFGAAVELRRVLFG